MVNQTAAMYIDPATTTLIASVITGLVVTVGTFLGIFWSKIKRAVKGNKDEEADTLDVSEVNALHDGEKDVITADDLLEEDEDDNK